MISSENPTVNNIKVHDYIFIWVLECICCLSVIQIILTRNYDDARRMPYYICL